MEVTLLKKPRQTATRKWPIQNKRSNSQFFPPGLAGNNGCGAALIQTPYFTRAQSNAEIITTLQVSSIIVCFCELISALLSSASESVQPGLINLGPVSVKCRLQTRARLFESEFNPYPGLNCLNRRLNFNRRFVALFKHRLTLTSG